MISVKQAICLEKLCQKLIENTRSITLQRLWVESQERFKKEQSRIFIKQTPNMETVSQERSASVLQSPDYDLYVRFILKIYLPIESFSIIIISY